MAEQRWSATLGLALAVAGCVAHPLRTPAQERVHRAFAECRYGDVELLWQSDTRFRVQGSADALPTVQRCMQQRGIRWEHFQ